MTKSRDIAKILGITEDNNPNSSRILFAGETLDSAEVTALAAVVSPTLTVYDSINELPVTSLVSGTQTYVRSNKKLYITLDDAYYNIATVNLTPTVTLDPSGTIVLSDSGQPSAIVTIIATDSDGSVANLIYSVESDGNMLGRATLTQDSSVFTIDPLTSDSGATAGTFTLTFKANDGINIGTATKDFSLTFAATAVDSSSSTVLLMKASGSNKAHEGISYQYGSDPILENVGFTTNTGTPIATSFSPYRSGGYSVYFDGTSDRIEMASIGDLSSTNYTIEGWYYFETDPNGATHLLWSLNDENTTGYAQLQTVSGTTTLRLQQRGGSYLSDGTFDFDTNTWYHIATVWDGTNMKVYVNGTEALSSTTNVIQNAGNGLTLNGDGGASYEFAGYIRDFRISTTARYTGSFTPPTEPLTADGNTDTLLCHAPYFGDGSTNNRAVTTFSDISIKPFGPYDYNPFTLQTDVGSTFLSTSVSGMAETTNHQTISNFGSGDFTIEMWYYPTTLGTYQTLYTGRPNTSQYAHITLFVNNQGKLLSYATSNGSSWDLVAEGGTTIEVTKNAWNHIAYVRNGNTWTMYVNGIGEVVSTNSGTLTANSNIQIGYENTNQFHQGAGYISDYRIVKGSAVYTSNFTPPTEKLTWITNTTLLLQNRYDTFIYDAAAGNEFKLLADAQSSTTQRKFNTSSSVYLDGTGDYIEIPNRQDMLTFGTGDFTIECWFRPSVVNINTAIMDFRPDSTTGSYPFIQPLNTDLKFKNVSSGDLIASGVLAANTWIHIAVVRSNGTTTLYTDGISRDTGADTTDYGCRSVPNIGKHNYAGANLNGYLQDLRITKGYGRYTANFTPPTAEFEL